ncbi:MAG: serine hydrolase domain-containing protein [Gemmatimonadales bacterium]
MASKSIAVAAVLLSTISAPILAQLPADTTVQVDRVFAALNRTDGPGCVLGVDRDGRELYRKGYGMASIELGAPLTPASILESGSVAKQFTAAVIIKLAVEGKLGLDDPIQKYIPELPDYGAPVTVRMLIHHTSGIRDMWTLFNLSGETVGENLFTMDRSLAMIYRQRELNFPPNSQFLYSNSGYLLLADLVQRVTGRTLDEYSTTEIFQPLGMTHTRWRSDWNRVVPGRAGAYQPVAGGFAIAAPFMHVYGAGGLLTTVGDMLIWNRELDRGTLAGPRWIEGMHAKQKLTTGEEIDYSSGLFIGTHRGQREIQHSGATGGYRTFLARYPDRNLSVAVLCNVANANPVALGRQVAGVLLRLPEATAQAQQGGGPGQGRTTAAGDGRITTPLASFAGTYYSDELDVAYLLSVQDTALALQVRGGPKVILTRSADDTFARSGAGSLRFTKGRNGRIDGFVMSAGRVQNLKFVKRTS